MANTDNEIAAALAVLYDMAWMYADLCDEPLKLQAITDARATVDRALLAEEERRKLTGDAIWAEADAAKARAEQDAAMRERMTMAEVKMFLFEYYEPALLEVQSYGWEKVTHGDIAEHAFELAWQTMKQDNAEMEEDI